MSGPRRLEVPAGRIITWVSGFVGGDGVPSWHGEGASLVLTAPDGTHARLESWADEAATVTVAGLDDLAAWARPPTVLALVLVRRGGYAVGLARDGDLVAHKVGSRYVQSRTAAGGWSQQRFARRRSNQADALVDTVCSQVERVVLGTGVRGPGQSERAATAPDALVLGGDRSLARAVLDDPRLRRLVDLPRRELPDLPDPRLDVLRTALRRARCVRVELR